MRVTLYNLEEPRCELCYQLTDYKYDVCKSGMLGSEPEDLFDTQRMIKDVLLKAGIKPENYNIPDHPTYGSYSIFDKSTSEEAFEVEVEPGAEFKCLEPLHMNELDKVMIDHMNEVKWMGLFIDDDGKTPEERSFIKVSPEGANHFSSYFLENKDKTDDEHIRWRQIECLLRENAKEKQHIKLHTIEKTPEGTRVEIQYSGGCPGVPLAPKTAVVNWDEQKLSDLTDKWLPVTLMCETNDGHLVDAVEKYGKKFEEIDMKYESDMNEWQKVSRQAEFEGLGVLTKYLEEKYGPNYEYMLVSNGCGEEIGFEKTPFPSDYDIPPITEEELERDRELAEEMERLEAEENARRYFSDKDLLDQIENDQKAIDDERWINNILQDID